MYIKLEDYGTLEIDEVYTGGYGISITSGNLEFNIFPSHEEAGRAARQYWEDMAHNDKKEFACLVGEETLIAWALDDWGGPGSTQTTSLSDWLDLWLDTPEEQWGGYDGTQLDVLRIGHLAIEAGWENEDLQHAIAYRWN